MGPQTAVRQAERAGHQVKEHPVLGLLASAGFVAYGLVYVLMAWLGLQLAFGDRAGKVSKNGALHELAGQPLGEALLWAAAIGFAALVIRSGIEALIGHRGKDGAARLAARGASAVRLAVYAALGFSAAKVAAGGSSTENPDGYTAKLFELPAGQWIVGAIAAAIGVYAVVSIWRGVTDSYRDDLEPAAVTGATGSILAFAARAGYCARGVAFGIVGGFFAWAALTHDPKKSAGLDQALSRLLDAPAGPILLAAVAAGFGCYGGYNILLAKYHRR